MARKTILICDSCGKEMQDETKGATVMVSYFDARRGQKKAEFCDECASKLPGAQQARRGRKPKAATAVTA